MNLQSLMTDPALQQILMQQAASANAVPPPGTPPAVQPTPTMPPVGGMPVGGILGGNPAPGAPVPASGGMFGGAMPPGMAAAAQAAAAGAPPPGGMPPGMNPAMGAAHTAMGLSNPGQSVVQPSALGKGVMKPASMQRNAGAFSNMMMPAKPNAVNSTGPGTLPTMPQPPAYETQKAPMSATAAPGAPAGDATTGAGGTANWGALAQLAAPAIASLLGGRGEQQSPYSAGTPIGQVPNGDQTTALMRMLMQHGAGG